MNKITTPFKLAFLLLAVSVVLISCNPIEKDTLSNSMLIIKSLTGFDIGGTPANFMQSDVISYDNTVAADEATALLTASLLAPEPLYGDSAYNSIMVTKYRISYFRSDGKNVEGVDVPYSFEGQLSTLINIDQDQSIKFILVRETAKLEHPLVDLQEGRDEGVLQFTAKVEFFGHDLTNENVKATGYLSVFCANYADSGGGNR